MIGRVATPETAQEVHAFVREKLRELYGALADSIRNGDTQVAQVHGGAAAFAQLSAIPDVRTGRLTTPRVLQLILRAKQPKLADPMVRKALLGLLDVDLLDVDRPPRRGFSQWHG